MTENQPSSFDWTISEAGTWPPRGRPRPPFGLTTLEVMRSCPLRCCFEMSRGYERQMGYAARVGIAFHRSIQSLTEAPLVGDDIAEVAVEARTRFHHELSVQDAKKDNRPRERFLPRDERRIQLATSAVMSEAQRLWRLQSRTTPPSTPTTLSTNEAPPAASVSEIPVQSQDKLLQGRIDYVERTPHGVRLLDFKSALRDDVPERYERQLQIYAYLWHETFGEWPVEAELVYPFTSTSHSVAIAPDICVQVADDARALIARVQSLSIERLATPGEVCQVCEFRPWCKSFWRVQAAEPQHIIALERAYIGIEGELTAIRLINDHYKLSIRWRNCIVTMVVSSARYPYLQTASIGDHIRILGARLQGMRNQPLAVAGDSTEIFILRP